MTTKSVASDEDLDITAWNTEPSPAHPHVALLLGGSLLAVVLVCVLPLFVVDSVRHGLPNVVLAVLAVIAAAVGVGPFCTPVLQSSRYVGYALVVLDVLPLVVVATLTTVTPARQWCCLVLIPVLLTAATLNNRFYRGQLIGGCLVGLPIMIVRSDGVDDAVLTSIGYVFLIAVSATLTRRYWATLHGRFEQLQHRSRTDELTGLLNRRGFVAEFPDLRQRAITDGAPLGMVMIDIDHFSRINAEHGHAHGDVVLQKVCALVSEQPELLDGLVARIGGEELVVVTAGAAEPVAQSLRAAVAEAGIHPGLTLSMGVADSDPRLCNGPEALWRLVNVTDSAMYRAKETGRDRIVVSSAVDVEPGGRPDVEGWPTTAAPLLVSADSPAGGLARRLLGDGSDDADTTDDGPTDHRLFGAYCVVFAVIGAFAYLLQVAIDRESSWAPAYLCALVLMACFGLVALRQGRRLAQVTATATILIVEVCVICAVLATGTMEHRLMITCVITVPALVAAQSMSTGWLASQYLLVFLCVGLAAYDGEQPVDAGWVHRTISLAVVISAAPAVLFWLRRRRRVANTRLQQLSATDPLTGVRNRTGLEQVALAGDRTTRWHVLATNIDGFKALNDTFGHVFGDQALSYLSGTLAKTVADHERSAAAHQLRTGSRPPHQRGTGAIVARTGGDRFVVLSPSPPDHGLIRRVKRAVTSLPVDLRLSFGQSEGPATDATELWTLVAAAEADLARSKLRR